MLCCIKFLRLTQRFKIFTVDGEQYRLNLLPLLLSCAPNNCLFLKETSSHNFSEQLHGAVLHLKSCAVNSSCSVSPYSGFSLLCQKDLCKITFYTAFLK